LSEETQAALREKKDYMAAFRILLPDGAIRHLESNGHHLFSADGELLGIMGTFVDVTERKRADDALREREAQLVAARRELRQMIDTIPILMTAMRPTPAETSSMLPGKNIRVFPTRRRLTRIGPSSRIPTTW